MKVNSSQHINFHNKQNNNVSKQKDTIISNVEKSVAPKKIAFYGLFSKKPLDATFVTSPLNLQAGQEYVVMPDTVLKLGETIIPLNADSLKDKIGFLKPNEKMYLGKQSLGIDSANPTVADNHLCIKKDKNGRLLASAVNKNYSTKILPNVITANTFQKPFKLNPAIYYELPIHSCLKMGKYSVDLADYKNIISSMQNGQKLILGRGNNADIMLDDTTISKSHCIIEKRSDKYYVKDLNSLNGTSFEKLTHPAMQKVEKDIFTLQKGVATKVDKDSQIYLGEDFAIDLRNKNILNLLYQKGNVTVGRSKDSDIVVPEFYSKVSRQHLNISMYNNEIYVTDLNSRNDTQIIPKNKIKPFYQGIENIELGQGNIGDCFLLVNLYALSRNPVGKEYLEKMVKVDDDGNYVVTFYNNPPIVVPLEQLDGQRVGNNQKICVSGDLGIRAIERAYAKKVNNFQDYGKTLMMEIDQGGKIPNALWDLTGISADSFSTKAIDVSKKFDELAKKPMENYVMLCSSHQKGKYGEYVDPQNRFIRKHAYAIKNIDNYNKMVEIINPHNTKVSYWVPYCEFSEIFDWLHVVDM